MELTAGPEAAMCGVASGASLLFAVILENEA
jgi:hypothetical protein